LKISSRSNFFSKITRPFEVQKKKSNLLQDSTYFLYVHAMGLVGL
jgi:hypothetical protein